MKKTHILLTLTVITAFGASSCARNEPPVVVEQQQAPAPMPVEPVRESSWKPAPVRSAVPQKTTRPAAAPVYQPAPPVQQQPVAQNATPPAQLPPQAQQQPVAAARPDSAFKPAQAASQPMKVTLVEGSVLSVRVGESLSSEKNESGDSWSGTLAEPLVINGLVIAERGALVEGRVTDAKRAGRVKGVASLSVTLSRLTTADGQRINLQTSGISRAGKDDTKRDVGKVAIASGIGAAIGAIAGGGKGAGIGAGAGAGAGTGVVLATRGGPAVIANEALLNFRVTEPVTITEKLR